MTVIKPLGLEISPRQTGKSTRLIAKARQHVAKGDVVRIVCSAGLQDHFSRQVPGALVRSDRQRFPSDLNADEGVWLYDEFEWLLTAELRSNAYYYSSPRFTRRLGNDSGFDLLLQLLQVNEGRFERYYWSFDMTDVLAEARLAYPPDEFRRLYLGEFFE